MTTIFKLSKVSVDMTRINNKIYAAERKVTEAFKILQGYKKQIPEYGHNIPRTVTSNMKKTYNDLIKVNKLLSRRMLENGISIAILRKAIPKSEKRKRKTTKKRKRKTTKKRKRR